MLLCLQARLPAALAWRMRLLVPPRVARRQPHAHAPSSAPSVDTGVEQPQARCCAHVRVPAMHALYIQRVRLTTQCVDLMQWTSCTQRARLGRHQQASRGGGRPQRKHERAVQPCSSQRRRGRRRGQRHARHALPDRVRGFPALLGPPHARPAYGHVHAAEQSQQLRREQAGNRRRGEDGVCDSVMAGPARWPACPATFRFCRGG